MKQIQALRANQILRFNNIHQVIEKIMVNMI